MNLFDSDNKLIQAMQTFGGFIVLNLCYVLCCLPVVSAGAATAALYTVTLQEARERSGSMISRFFQAFRDNWKKATWIWLALLLIGAILVYNYCFLTWNPQLNTPVMMGLLIAMAIVYLMLLTYALPMQAMFENSVLRTLRNAMVLAVGNLPRTVVMTALNALPLAILLFSEELFWRISILLVLIWFSGIAYLNSRLMMKIFTRFIPEDAA